MDEIKEQLESLKNLTNEKEELDKNSNELQEIRDELQQLNKDASFAMPGTMQKELKNEKIKEKSEEYETKEKELKDKKEKLNGKFLENKDSLIEKIDEEMSKYKRKSELDQLKSTKSAYEKVAENAQKTIEKFMQDISEGKLIDQSLLANARSEVEENTKKAEEIGKELDGYIELESNIEQYTELEYLKTRTIGLQIDDLKPDLENKFIENNFKKEEPENKEPENKEPENKEPENKEPENKEPESKEPKDKPNEVKVDFLNGWDGYKDLSEKYKSINNQSNKQEENDKEDKNPDKNEPENKKNFKIKIGRTAEINIGDKKYNLGKRIVKNGVKTNLKDIYNIIKLNRIETDIDKLKEAVDKNYIDPTVITIMDKVFEKNLKDKDISQNILNAMEQYIKNGIDASENKEVKESNLDITYDEGDLSKTSILSRITFSEINAEEKFKLASRGRIASRNNLANIEGEYIPDRKSRFFNRLIFKKTPLLPTANDNSKVAVIYNDLLLRGETDKINSSIEMQKLNLTELQQQELKELYESEIEKKGGIEKVKDMSNPDKSKDFRENYKVYFNQEEEAQNSDEDKEEENIKNILDESQKGIGKDVSEIMDGDEER